MNKIKILQDKDSSVINLSDNMQLKNRDRIEIMKSDDLKHNSVNTSMRSSPPLKPNLREEHILHRHSSSSPKPNLTVPPDDLNLLVNPKKTKNYGSSSDEEYSQHNDDLNDNIFKNNEEFSSHHEDTVELLETNKQQSFGDGLAGFFGKQAGGSESGSDASSEESISGFSRKSDGSSFSKKKTASKGKDN